MSNQFESIHELVTSVELASHSSLSKRDQLQLIIYSYQQACKKVVHHQRSEIINYIINHQSDLNVNIQGDLTDKKNVLQLQSLLRENVFIMQCISSIISDIVQIYEMFYIQFPNTPFHSVLGFLFEEDPLLLSLIEYQAIVYFVQKNISNLKSMNLSGIPFEKKLVLFINEKIVEKCSSKNEKTLSDLLKWLENNVLSILGPIGIDLRIWKIRFQQCLYREMSKKLINNLFNIVVDYPETRRQILDLKECLIHTGMHDDLVRSLRVSNRKRLLHLGAHTNDIIIQYTNIIKTLNFLDPTGVSLSRVSRDINQFLRNRKDAIRYFVNSIIDEENDLFEELMDATTVNVQDEEDCEITESSGTSTLLSSQDNSSFVNHFWAPKSIYPDASKQQTKKPSIINIFVNIFENVDLFVNEYQIILCQQLLKNVSFDTTNPSKILELLKIRFGENSLQKCEVMLKDIIDSHRLHKNILEKLQVSRRYEPYFEFLPSTTSQTFQSTLNSKKILPFSSKIISKYYWPTLAEEKCKLHPIFQEIMDQYERSFTHLKSPRHLVWLPFLGNIQFEIEIGGTTVELNATPFDASILLYLSEHKKLSSQFLSQRMESSVDIIEKRLKYWILRGVVLKGMDLFSIVEELNENFDPDLEVDEDAELKEEENEIDENIDDFVRGILGHFKKASIDTIHHLLSISMDSFDKTVPQLQKYLCTRTEIFEFDASSREFIIITKSEK